MTAIGIDTHKATLAACAIDELGRAIGEATFANDPAGHDAFIAWARLTAPEATIGVEGSSSFGAPLARSVQLAGLAVREVPPHLSRAERAESGEGRNTHEFGELRWVVEDRVRTMPSVRRSRG